MVVLWATATALPLPSSALNNLSYSQDDATLHGRLWKGCVIPVIQNIGQFCNDSSMLLQQLL
ncbi:MAG: hypothetical protein AAF959_05090 [Cyanobacteria bacterium P01_D01_bin.56]